MSADIDQHAAFELNSIGNRICKRDGASCDIFVAGFDNQMHIIATIVTLSIITELPFNKLCIYGKDRPIHLSLEPDHKRSLHVIHSGKNSKHNVGRGATDEKAQTLLQTHFN